MKEHPPPPQIINDGLPPKLTFSRTFRSLLIPWTFEPSGLTFLWKPNWAIRLQFSMVFIATQERCYSEHFEVVAFILLGAVRNIYPLMVPDHTGVHLQCTRSIRAVQAITLQFSMVFIGTQQRCSTQHFEVLACILGATPSSHAFCLCVLMTQCLGDMLHFM